MGFGSDGRLRYADIALELLQRIVFDGDPPEGEIVFAPAFDLDRPAG